MFRIVFRRLAILGFLTISASACGAAASSVPQAPSAKAPTYAQVLFAMLGAQSFHLHSTAASGASGDFKADADGAILGTYTIIGDGSTQLYVQLSAEGDAPLTVATFDMTPDAAWVTSCGCNVLPNVCHAYTPAQAASIGVNPQTYNDDYTPAGVAKSISTAVPLMTVQGTAIVEQIPVYVFKGSGRELDVPFGSRLPIRFVHAGFMTSYMSDWNNVGPITAPTPCP